MNPSFISRNRSSATNSTTNQSLHKYADKTFNYSKYVSNSHLFKSQSKMLSSLSIHSQFSKTRIITPVKANLLQANDFCINDISKKTIQSYNSFIPKTVNKSYQITPMSSEVTMNSSKDNQKRHVLIEKSINRDFKEVEVEGRFCLLGQKSPMKNQELFLTFKQSKSNSTKGLANRSLPFIQKLLRLNDCNRFKISEKIKEKMKKKILGQQCNFDFFSNSHISKAIFLNKSKIHIELPVNIYLKESLD